MDKQSPDDEAARKAADHHSKASELFREFRRDGDDALVGRANAEVARADEWEQSAPKEPGFERDGEADPSTSRRTWYKQGSVGDEPLQQFQEAEQDGSLFAQLLNFRLPSKCPQSTIRTTTVKLSQMPLSRGRTRFPNSAVERPLLNNLAYFVDVGVLRSIVKFSRFWLIAVTTCTTSSFQSIRLSTTMVRAIKAVGQEPTIPDNFPILVDSSMRIIPIAFAFMLYIATIPGRSRSPETIRTYSESLVHYFGYLEQIGEDWHSATHARIALYRNSMNAKASPHTGRPYQPSTINQRLRAIAKLYGWAHLQGWIEDIPFTYEDVYVTPGKKSSFLGHVDGSPNKVRANDLTLRQYRKLPRAVSVPELKRFFRSLAALPEHFALVAEWQLCTGMRAKEVVGLRWEQIDPLTDPLVRAQRSMPIEITVTKGDKPRTVFPTVELIDKTNRYIMNHRNHVVRAAQSRNASYKEPGQLFLSERGTPLRRQLVSKTFSRIFKLSDVLATGHYLRHTYALTTLAALQEQVRRGENLNPLLILKELMGHESIESTAIYLRCADLTPAVTQGVEYLYGEVVQ